MSTSKGSTTRKRPQKHQNRSAFKNDLHDTSKRTKILNSLEVSGVCKHCKDIIEWKIKYKKYKALTVPAKCVGCNEKAVKHAYHVLCRKCAAEKKVCAKCCKPPEHEEAEIQTKTDEGEDLETVLKLLPERKKRTILRQLKKLGAEEGKLTSEAKACIEEIMAGIKDVNLGDDAEFGFSSDGDDNELDADSDDEKNRFSK